MKTNSLFTILFLFPVLIMAQTKTTKVSKLTGSSDVSATVREYSNVGISFNNNCDFFYNLYLEENTKIIICGTDSCIRKEWNDTTRYFVILHDDDYFYIEKNKIKTNPTYYKQIANMSPEMADSFRRNAIRYSILVMRIDSISEIMKALVETKMALENKIMALNFLEKTVPKGLAVLNWSYYDESEYTSGTSIKLEVYNPTKKTIKYIWFTFVGYNAVDDKVTDIKRGTFITMKGIGPIETKSIANYVFEYVWFTDIVETAKISSIKVQYMDGTFKTIIDPKSITLSQSYYDILFSE